ncbi:MAG: ArsR family transcriptional regulator [Candidatus Methanoperedens sp.]|nr:ArsR family transcriptional regulator [Candidatus Methanoperedens sp.]
MSLKILHIAIFCLISVSIVGAAPDNYKVTYTINIKENGSAIWDVEYRTLLSTKEDFDSFENYSAQINSKYLVDFKELMQRSAQEAAVATARTMAARDFNGEAIIQSTPTGKYGVVRYTFTWTNFAKTGQNINVGDVFVGGLYLSNDNTLIIRYPQDYTVEQVVPGPDQNRDGMIWYGLRSFSAGEPRIILAKPLFTSTTVAVLVIIGLFITVSMLFVKRRKEAEEKTSAEISETNIHIPEIEMLDVEDRIMKMLKESGGALYQSEIVRQLNLPKSTVSSVLNKLHDKNVIQKIRKGRENLIRMV